MTKYGSAFSGTDTLKRAPGASHNAALRAYKNRFDLAAEGGTAQPLKIADVGPGCVPHSYTIETDANLSGLTFTIGTAAAPAKYGAAVAGPNATVAVRYPLISLDLTPSTVREEIFLTPSGNLPGAGTIRTTVVACHR